MKLLALADIHGESYFLDRLRVRLSKSEYEAVIVAGDITNRGPAGFAEELLEFAHNTYAVHGNMDTPEVLGLLEEKGVSIHGRRVELGEYSLVGYGGSNPTPFNTPTEYDEKKIESELALLRIDGRTILVTHSPPHGTLDTVGGNIHVGSTAVKNIIVKKQPLACICAHIHETEGEGEIGKTKVVKLGPAERGRVAEITLDENGVKVKFQSV